MINLNKNDRTGENRAGSSEFVTTNDSRNATSVGDTVVTSMGDKIGREKLISIETTVLKLLDTTCPEEEGFNASCRSIVESLLWVFVARRSSREVMFTEKEFGRFRASMRQTALRLKAYQSPDCREQGYCKFWCDTYLAMVIGDDDRPSRESWMKDSLFVGWCKRFVARALAKRDFSFFYSLQKGTKQMWEPLGKENVRKSILKSQDRLCSPRGSVNIPDGIIEHIHKMSLRVFGKIPVNIVGQKFMPSGSACLQASIINGGALGLFEPLNEPTKLLGFSALTAANVKLATWRQVTWQTCYDRCMAIVQEGGEELEKLFATKFVPLYEASKIRNISIADGYLATALQPLQGSLLSAWKAVPQSTMLLQLDDYEERITQIDSLVKEDYWCSGDYEAATDLLYRAATLAAFRGVPDGHPLTMLGFLSLTSGSMRYPNLETLKFENKDGEDVSTTLPIHEGQLMGHTLSFPLLCLINLSVLEYSLKLWVQTFTIKVERREAVRRARLIFENSLINGDDILFKGPSELMSIFRSTAASVGFKTSQGKNYISMDTCMINSKLFHRNSGRMKQYGYLNLRLIKGKVSSVNHGQANPDNGKFMVDPTTVGTEIERMVKLCSWSLGAVPTALKRWDKINKQFKWFTPNWYLPVSLGGYGVPLKLAPRTLEINRAQRLVAAYFVNDDGLSLYSRSKLTSITKIKTKATLQFRRLSGSYVPNSNEVMLTFKHDDEWMERLTQVERASYNRDVVKHEVFGFQNYSFVCMLMVSRIRKDYRLKPMSAQGLVDHWNDTFVSNLTPECPPLPPIRILSQKDLMRSINFLGVKKLSEVEIQKIDHMRQYITELKDLFKSLDSA